MHRKLVIILVLATLLTGCRPSESTLRQTILQNETDWGTSFVTADPAVSERLLAPDFVWLDAQGKRWNRTELLATFRKQPTDLLAIHLDDVQVRLFDNVAVAQGTESSLLKGRDGQSRTELSDFTDVWVYRDHKWQLSVSQDSVVPVTAKSAP